MIKEENYWIVLLIGTAFAGLVAFFARLDSRVASLEKWRDEVNPQRVTQKDMMLLEEKIKHIDSKIDDIKEALKK